MDTDPAGLHARRAASFGAQAAAYALHRPTYPPALLEWGLEPVRDRAEPTVLDLAAGTGKVTEGLVALGVRVVAVEPDPAMLAQLTTRFPDVTAHQGTAERIPLPDASVDALFVGQALHWFDLAAAVPQMRRVVRPGGPLVAMWNYHDDRLPWVRRMCSLTGMTAWSADQREATHPPQALAAVGHVTTTIVEHSMRRTADSLVGVVATHSDMLVAEPAERDAVLARLRRFLATEPATAGGEFVVPMIGFGMRVVPD